MLDEEYALKIPVLSWIFGDLKIPDLKIPCTTGTLFSTVVAVPVTILFKLAHNGKPPFTEDDIEKSRHFRPGAPISAADQTEAGGPLGLDLPDIQVPWSTNFSRITGTISYSFTAFGRLLFDHFLIEEDKYGPLPKDPRSITAFWIIFVMGTVTAAMDYMTDEMKKKYARTAGFHKNWWYVSSTAFVISVFGVMLRFCAKKGKIAPKGMTPEKASDFFSWIEFIGRLIGIGFAAPVCYNYCFRDKNNWLGAYVIGKSIMPSWRPLMYIGVGGPPNVYYKASAVIEALTATCRGFGWHD
jgi:hypothetical protein